MLKMVLIISTAFVGIYNLSISQILRLFSSQAAECGMNTIIIPLSVNLLVSLNLVELICPRNEDIFENLIMCCHSRL
jgi:hypothetical protein